MNLEKTEFTFCEQHDNETALLLVAFDPDAKAKQTLHFRHKSGLLARVFVGKNDEPIAIRFRGNTPRAVGSESTLPSDPLEASKLIARAITKVYGLATFLIELARERELIKLGEEIIEDCSGDDEQFDDGAIQISNDVASATERIIGLVPKNVVEHCVA